MYTYKAFYKNSEIEIQAATSYQAQCQAVNLLKVSKSGFGLLSIVLVAKPDGTIVVHTPNF